MVDADVPTPELPLVHWLHINLQVTPADRSLDWSSGLEIQAYLGPMPRDNRPHTYYFMVLEQTGGLLDITGHSAYSENCPNPELSDRSPHVIYLYTLMNIQ